MNVTTVDLMKEFNVSEVEASEMMDKLNERVEWIVKSRGYEANEITFKLWSNYGKRRAYYQIRTASRYQNNKPGLFVEL